MKVILIPGTWANTGRDAPQDDWWKIGSPFASALAAHGFEPLSFAWNPALDGVLGPNADWMKAADKLWAQSRNLQPVNLIAHSHGGQLPFYASARHGLNVRCLVTMATPVRADVPYSSARTKIQRWIHIFGGVRDYTQILGSLAFFRFNVLRRRMKFADHNIKIPESGHDDLHTAETWSKYNLWEKV